MVLFSRGKTEDKLRIIFDMCDNDRNGVIDKGELSDMLRSLVEIARTTSLSDAQVTELIDGMFQVCVPEFYFCKLFYQENFTGSEEDSWAPRHNLFLSTTLYDNVPSSVLLCLSHSF